MQVNMFGTNANEHPPEDGVREPLQGARLQNAQRRQRVIMNDLENIPVDLAVFWSGLVVVFAGSLSGACVSEALALTVVFPAYTAARVLHSVFYLRAMQPFRSISFGFGLLSVLSAAGVLIAASVKVLAL
jgi:microsomal prostaglandin-E synthase 1